MKSIFPQEISQFFIGYSWFLFLPAVSNKSIYPSLRRVIPLASERFGGYFANFALFSSQYEADIFVDFFIDS